MGEDRATASSELDTAYFLAKKNRYLNEGEDPVRIRNRKIGKPMVRQPLYSFFLAKKTVFIMESNGTLDVFIFMKRRTDMIGKKEMALIGTGKKLIKKYKKSFSNFTDHDFYARIILVDDTGSFVKAIECIVNADNWMNYINEMDFGNYKVDKIEFSAR